MSIFLKQRRVRIFARVAYRVLSVLLLLAFSSLLPADEKPAPSKPDPILADLTTTATAEWRPKLDFMNDMKPQAPTLGIAVELQGTAAKQASAFGELMLDSVVAQDGKSYRQACWVYRNGEMRENFPKINALVDRNNKNLRVDLSIRNRPPIESFREIRGSLALHTGGEFKAVVVQNAFKNFGKPSDNRAANAEDIQWIAKPLQDNSLDGLGIRIAARRLAVTAGESRAKDHVVIEVQSTDPIVDCDILDAQGKPMTYARYSFTGNTPLWLFDFNTTGKILPDARLRLTLHKNGRKIRVPFEFKNVAVPKIDEHDMCLNVPASADDTAWEAETVPPGDPILAGLQISAKANWLAWPNDLPMLQMNIELQGTPIAQASGCGDAEVASLSNAAGNPLHLPSAESRMATRFGDPSQQGGPFSLPLVVPILLPRATFVSTLHEMRGSMSLQLGGHYETIVVKDFLKKVKKAKDPIEDATLKSLGIVVEVEHQKTIDPDFGGVQALNLHIQWKRSPVVWCQVVDAKGQRLDEGSSSSCGGLGERTEVGWWQSFKEAIPDDAQLRLTIHKDCQKVRVPFEFKDIKVPPMP
jgi:hypothetical protein